MQPFAMERSGDKRKLSILACIYLTFFNRVAQGRTLTDAEMRSKLKSLNKPAVKSIQSQSGSIIDCVDIYKQPAFDHPLLQNHTIQMRPSYYDDQPTSSSGQVRQPWNKNESCPEGTIPIIRVTKSDLLRMERYGEKQVSGTRESARLKQESDYIYHGGFGIVTVWKINVEPNEYSSAGIYVSTINPPDVISAGWMIYPQLYGDSRTRLFTNWVATNGGCYDLKCPGFVQTNKQWTLGGELEPVSIYGGTQYAINVTVRKDDHWWLEVNETPVGYWPGSLFKTMVSAADRVEWGGQIYNTQPGGRHTGTEMGSGLFPREGANKAAMIANAYVFDTRNKIVFPYPAEDQVDKNTCYDMKALGQNVNGPGMDLFFGGPGGPDCDK